MWHLGRPRRSRWDRHQRRSGRRMLAASTPGKDDLALLLASGLLALRFLALPLHAGLLVVLATASLRENAALLDLLVEAAKGALERLVLTHSDFCQSSDHLPRP